MSDDTEWIRHRRCLNPTRDVTARQSLWAAISTRNLAPPPGRVAAGERFPELKPRIFAPAWEEFEDEDEFEDEYD